MPKNNSRKYNIQCVNILVLDIVSISISVFNDFKRYSKSSIGIHNINLSNIKSTYCYNQCITAILLVVIIYTDINKNEQIKLGNTGDQIITHKNKVRIYYNIILKRRNRKKLNKSKVIVELSYQVPKYGWVLIIDGPEFNQ
ncbi:hypothetical protein QTP88_007442 [Uroleucon formosanum]